MVVTVGLPFCGVAVFCDASSLPLNSCWGLNMHNVCTHLFFNRGYLVAGTSLGNGWACVIELIKKLKTGREEAKNLQPGVWLIFQHLKFWILAVCNLFQSSNNTCALAPATELLWHIGCNVTPTSIHFQRISSGVLQSTETEIASKFIFGVLSKILHVTSEVPLLHLILGYAEGNISVSPHLNK